MQAPVTYRSTCGTWIVRTFVTTPSLAAGSMSREAVKETVRRFSSVACLPTVMPSILPFPGN